jgi:hypothetical protein
MVFAIDDRRRPPWERDRPRPRGRQDPRHPIRAWRRAGPPSRSRPRSRGIIYELAPPVKRDIIGRPTIVETGNAPALQARLRGHRLQAPGILLSVRTEQDLAQDQEPVGPGRATVQGRALGHDHPSLGQGRARQAHRQEAGQADRDLGQVLESSHSAPGDRFLLTGSTKSRHSTNVLRRPGEPAGESDEGGGAA